MSTWLASASWAFPLAPPSRRAAAYDHRFAGLFMIDGMYSIQATWEADLPSAMMTLFKSGNATAFDIEMNKVRIDPKSPSSIRWLVDQGLWAFHTASPFDWFSLLGSYAVDGVFATITCPVFVGDGQDDTNVPGQAPVVAAALGDLAALFQFNNSLGAGQHCQLGAEPHLAQASLDWFQGVLDAKRE
ncbi:hypothetical protein MMC18_005575 [Xylographa bjoerkii]|nr:hypothetical protein [Xylographa bjoerkii]